jgi:hypothetical protein
VRPDQPDDEPASDGPEPASEHLDLARDESEAAGHEPHRPPEQTPPAAPPRSARDAADGTTVEYDVERALGNEEGDEDVLEETPEFLQDTPDHDRLWFEQRPPRDFDFDG